MALLTPTLLGSGFSTALATATATVTIPDYCLIIVDVVNRHTTPASLGTVAVTSPNATWVQDTTVTEGGASPTRRMTSFRALVPLHLAGEVITATASGAQTGIELFVTCLPGALVTGSNGANAVRQSVSGNTAGANATALPLTLAAFGGTLNGAFVRFASSVGVSTPKTGWTELADSGLIAGCQYESQYILSNDVTANGTFSNGIILGIVTEIVAVPNPISVNASSSGGLLPTATPGYVSGLNAVPGGVSVTLRAGRTSFLVFEMHGSSPNVTAWGVTYPANVSSSTIYTRLAGGATTPTIRIDRVTLSTPFDITGNLTFSCTATGAGNVNITVGVIEVANMDVVVGTAGVIQLASANNASSGATLTATLGAFASLQNCAIAFAATAGSGAPPFNATQVGWKEAMRVVGNGGVQAFFRPGPALDFSAVAGGSVNNDLIVIEVAGVPANSPTVTLVSPANLSTITPTSSITIDIADIDGDLTSAVSGLFTANGSLVLDGAGAFTSNFSTSTKTAITNGWRYVITRTGGWPVGALNIYVVADDAQSHHGFGNFNFTNPAPATHAPDITLVSPSLGPIAPTNPVAFTATDVDADLALVTVTVEFPTLGVIESAYNGSAFSALYASLSTILTIALGKQLNVARSGGWPDAAGIIVHVTATDAVGNVTTANFSFSPVTFPAPPPTPAPVATTSATVAERGRDILIDPVTNNIVLTSTGDLSLVGGAPSVAQAIRQVLNTFVGEWFYNTSAGVDWWDSVLIKNPNVATVRAVVRVVIEAVPGVGAIEALDVTLDPAARALSITFTVSTDLGELIVDTVVLAALNSGVA